MDCPRCGQAAVTEAACPRCGVIVAKARARKAPTDTTTFTEDPDPEPDPPSRINGLAVVVGGAVLLLAGAVGSRLWDRAHRPPPGTAIPGSMVPMAVSGRPSAGIPEGPPPVFSTPVPPAPQDLHVDAGQVPDAERERADALVRRLANPASLTAADVKIAEDLLAAHPDEKALRELLQTVLLSLAQRLDHQRQFTQAIAYLQRAREVQPASIAPLLILIQVDMEIGDWSSAEAAARAAITVDPRSFDAWQGLGYALMKQDRKKEAVEALRSALDIHDDTPARSLMERLQKSMSDERGMAERRVSHFTVRYDGEEHEAVGREIVRALERHYATLASALDYEPANTISVTLFTREGYYNASGAPAWSGGVFDNTDGQIRVPVGGLGTSLTPDMDGTLIHELTHAFIFDRTHGTAPHELHEGLAQYMEGKRLERWLTRAQLGALADGRIGGVAGFYLSALSFVEYLVANRGMGGMNDLLQAMGETGSVDKAFEQVYGMTFHAAQQAWTQRFRQQYGSS
jgi:tetratricopeptide (TPR) repeat protein